MDLTPEQRLKIYEEEKARLEALDLTSEERREIYESEKARLAEEEGGELPQGEEQRRNPWIGAAILGVVFFVVIGIISSRNQPHESQSVTSNGNPQLVTQAETLIGTCRANGIITELDYSSDHVRVVMGRPFLALEFKSKEGLCLAISYVSKSRGGPSDFILRDAMTNKQIGSFVGGALNLD